MCGITGFVNFSIQPDKKNLERSLKEIIHRGPDSSGYYIDKHVALGIRRLSIIDLKTGDQPISNEDNTVTVVFNGEIYNFQQLEDDLLKKGHHFKTKTDTEVLVHLYEDDGEQMLNKLNGMFAFAIWDKKKEKLFVARDHVGIKPLYFYQKGDLLIFGSEVKTILKHPQIKKAINSHSLALYSYFGYIPGDESIFKGVDKLPPGNYLTFSRKGLSIKKYFAIKKTENDDLAELFADAIKRQSIADVPLGVFLSGGLDSTLVTYYLTKVSSKVKTFSISFSEKSFDEGQFAAIVARQLGTDHREGSFSVKDVISDFNEISQKLDEPFADPSLFPTYKLSKFTRKYVKVALSGDGGDELFGGYPTYQGQLLAQKLHLIPNGLLTLSANVLNLLPRSYENYPKSEVWNSLLKGVPKKVIERHLFWMSIAPLGQKPFFDLKKVPWYSKMVRQSLNGDVVKTTQLLDFKTYLPDDLLVKVDRASMFNSLEVRVPFLDSRIINFAFSKERHVDFFQTKKLLRNLLKNKMPQSIVNRKKKGFGIPLSRWVLEDLSKLVREKLENRQLYNYFDKKQVDKLVSEHKRGKQNNAKIIWMLVMFSGWLENWGSF